MDILNGGTKPMTDEEIIKLAPLLVNKEIEQNYIYG